MQAFWAFGVWQLFWLIFKFLGEFFSIFLSPWAQCYKTFYARSLRIYVISLSVFLSQVFPSKSKPRMGHLKDVLLGLALALQTNTRQGF
jgi:hypothetical protein